MSWFQQIIPVAANGRDEGGWIQLVVFIVIGVVYALGSLAKSRANKELKKEPEKQPKDKRRYKPIEEWSTRTTDKRQVGMPEVQRQEQERPTRAIKPGISAGLRVQQPIQPQRRRVRPRPPRRDVDIRQQVIPPVKVGPELVSLPTEVIPEQVLPELSPPKLGKIQKLEVRLEPLSEQKEPEAEVVAEPVVTPLLGYEEADPLRAAILYCEILGKPLALRDRPGGIW